MAKRITVIPKLKSQDGSCLTNIKVQLPVSAFDLGKGANRCAELYEKAQRAKERAASEPT